MNNDLNNTQPQLAPQQQLSTDNHAYKAPVTAAGVTSRVGDIISRNRKSVIATMFALGIAIMSGSAFYVANYSYQNRQNLSLNTDSQIGASNVSCLLDLTIATPTPTPTPVVTPTPIPTPLVTPTPLIVHTSTPSASPITCSLCQYQLDMFWGPVINMFTSTDTYYTSKRLIGSKFDRSTLPICNLNQTSYEAAPILPVFSSSCSDPVTNGYLTGYIDSTTKKSYAGGYASAKINNTTTNCTYDVGFASYKANGDTLSLQNLYDFKTTQQLGPGASVTMYVKTPMIGDSAACHNLPL